MSDLPLVVDFDTVRDFLESIGIDPAQTREVHFGLDEMTVEQTRLDPIGRATFGTVTTTIPYKREGER